MKLIKLCSIVLLLLLSLCGCKNEIEKPEEIEKEESIELILPTFEENISSAISTRGLIDIIPNGNKFNDDFGAATAVMSYYPMFNKLESKNYKDIKAINEDIKNNRNKYRIWGYEIELKENKNNDDGVFLSYLIKEKGQDIGRIDYYYNEKNQTFSYRQIIGLNLKITDNMWNDTSVLAIEYIDIPVDKKGNFTLGLDNQGHIKQNAIVDMFTFFTNNGRPKDSNKPENIIDTWKEVEFRLTRSFPIARMQNGTMHLLLDSEKEETYSINFKFDETIKNGPGKDKKIDEIMADGKSELQIDTENEAQMFDINAVYLTMAQYYESSFNRENYTSFDNFKNDTLKNLKENAKKTNQYLQKNEFLIFNSKSGKVAALTKWGEEMSDPFSNSNTSPYLSLNKSFCNEKEFDLRGYTDFGYKIKENNPTDFLKSFIEKIGITDSQWLTDFEEYVKDKLYNSK